MHVSIGVSILILGLLFLATSKAGRRVLGVVGGTLAVALAGVYYLLWVVPQSDKTRELTKLASLSSIPLKAAPNAWDGKPRTISYDVSEGSATDTTESGKLNYTVTIGADRALHFSLPGSENEDDDAISSDGVLVSRRIFGHEDNGPDGKLRVLARCVWRTASAAKP
jgi:hypothetical protein